MIDDKLIWTHSSKAFFLTNGYIILRGFVPLRDVQTAHAKQVGINEWKGTPATPSWKDRDTSAPEILKLFTPALEYRIASCLGGAVDPNAKAGAQYARVEKGTVTTQGPHVDGYGDSRQTHISHYALLVGICLTDTSQSETGNLMVQPGSHMYVSSWLSENRPPDILQAFGKWPPYFRASAPLHLIPGDAVISHHLLIHEAGLNTRGDMHRDMVYFRIRPDGAPYRISSNDHSFYEEPLRYCRGLF